MYTLQNRPRLYGRRASHHVFLSKHLQSPFPSLQRFAIKLIEIISIIMCCVVCVDCALQINSAISLAERGQRLRGAKCNILINAYC